MFDGHIVGLLLKLDNVARYQVRRGNRFMVLLNSCYIVGGLHSVVRGNDVMKRTQAQLCLTLYL